MNTASVITASVFSVLSIAVLIYLFIGKSEFANGKYKGFYRACCGVYVSGALLVLLFTIILKGLPVAFVVISDGTVLCVFVFTAGLIFFMTKKIIEASNQAGKAEKNEDSEKKDK
jgi:hypothetical protein